MKTELGFKYDQGKPRMELLPFDALEEVAKVLTFGAEKYKDDSWRSIPDGIKRYEGALLRHLAQYKEARRKSKSELDPESNIHHLAHLACNALFILSLRLEEVKELNHN